MQLFIVETLRRNNRTVLKTKERNKEIDNLIKLITERNFNEISRLEIDNVKVDSLDIISDSVFIRKVLFNKKENHKKFKKKHHLEKRIFELLILEHTNLFLILSEYFFHNNREKNLKQKDVLRIRHLIILLNNKINFLKSILIQIEYGLTQGSYIVFRSYMEAAEKSIAILANEEYFDYYFTEAKNRSEEFNIWKQTKPSKTFEIVREHLLKLPPEKFNTFFFDIRKTLYSKTSKAVHGQLSSSITESLVENKDEFLKWSFLGKQDERIKEILIEYLIYIRIISKSLLITLIKDYKLNLKKFGKEGVYHTVIFKTNEECFRFYLGKLTTPTNL